MYSLRSCPTLLQSRTSSAFYISTLFMEQPWNPTTLVCTGLYYILALSGIVLIQIYSMAECQLGLFLEITTFYNLATLKVHFFHVKEPFGAHLGTWWASQQHYNVFEPLGGKSTFENWPRNIATVDFFFFFMRKHALHTKRTHTQIAAHPAGSWVGSQGLQQKLTRGVKDHRTARAG